MSVRTRQAFRSSGFGSSVPVIAPMYSARCETWALEEDGVFRCGSNSDCALRLDVAGIESLHCSFQLQNGTLTVRRERGRVWVNELPVSSEAILTPGDVLTLGPVTFSLNQLERELAPAANIVSPSTVVPSAVASTAPQVSAETIRIDNAQVPVAAALPAQVLSDEHVKAMELRERQLLDRAALVEERERLVQERQQAQDERAAFLAEQKALVEKHQQSFALNEAALKRQKDDLDQRVRSMMDREQQLARQMEESAQAYAKLEASRLKLNDELDRIAQREAAVAERSEELTRASKETAEHREKLASEHDATLRLQADLSAREADLAAQSERLQQHEAELQRLSSELVARRMEIEALHSRSNSESSEVRALLESREQMTAELQRQLAESESRRLTETEQRETLQHSLESATQTLSERTMELSFAAERLAASDSMIQELKAQLEFQQQQIETLKSQRPDEAPRSQETRTVEQLAAIASEREAALRARQDAFVIQKQVQEARERLAADERRLQAWQAEIDQRHDEVARRVISLKAAMRSAEENAARRNAAQQVAIEAIDLNALQAERDALAAERESLQSLRHDVLARETELRTAEARVAELEESARSMQRAAETEREAFAASHRDLLFERNAHQQRSQDLVSREAGLHERELLVSRQTEELRSRFEAINQQTAELRKYEGELNARGAELHRQILDWKTESRSQAGAVSDSEQSAVVSSGTDNRSLTLGQITEELRELSGQNESLVAEREALMTAIRELQKALQDARSDVEEASRIKAASTKQEQTIAQLYQQIEERSNLLQLSESRFHQLHEELEETRRLLQLTHEASTKEQSETTAPSAGVETATNHHESDELETQLLSQIENLRGELSTSAAENSSRQAEYTSLITDRDAKIRHLEEAVLSLQEELRRREEVPATSSAETSSGNGAELDALRDRLEKAEHVLQDRDDLIRELRSRLMQQARPEPASLESGSVPERDSLQSEARELDRRAQLLDHREEEIRERSRRLEQSEEEVETQRRQLLDARQQLEIARAEIQVAMKHHSAPQVPPALPSDAFATAAPGRSSAADFAAGLSSQLAERDQTSFSFDSSNSSESEAETSSGTDLRSELASLFGLKKATPEPPPTPSSAGPLISVSEFVDLTEATGQAQAVALKFGQDASALVESVPAPAAEAEPAREENSDDFVRDYMEQLLARSRKSAGNALPSELKTSETKKPEPAPAAAQVKKNESAAARKEGPKVKSFIEQYMAGGFGDLTGEGNFQSTAPIASEPEQEDVVESSEPKVPRQKIDLQKLREDMDSFRTLSTQSVENALVDHAIRKERHSINGRIMFVAVLVIMTVFLAIANLKGIINHPSITWVCMVAAIGAAAELARKYVSLKARCRVGLQGEAGSESEEPKLPSEDAEVRRILSEEKAAAIEVPKPRPVASLELDEETPRRESSERFLMQEDDEHERSRYFEL